jgi:RND family efflux transporter MFP subunit
MRRVTILLVTSILALASCGGPPQGMGGQMPPPPVGVASPIARPVASTRVFTGRLEALHTVELKPQVGGVVQKVLVADGAEVTAGQPILVIDPAPFEAKLSRAEAEAARARADISRAEADIARTDARLTQARLQDTRVRTLFENKNSSQQAVDEAAANLRASEAEQSAAVTGLVAAKAASAAAEASLITAKLDLSYTTVTAPIAGRIGKILASTGNLVNGAGGAPATLLTTLVVMDPIEAAFDLDEETWRAMGDRLRASAQGGEAVLVKVGLPGENGFPHEGKVSFADNRIDSASGSIRVRAKIPDPKGQLTPGAFARIELELAAAKPALLVHERVILSQLATRYVLTVDEKGGTAFRPVVLGANVGDLRVIEQGVAPTDRIAVNNLAKIFFPGMPVTPLPADMATTQNLAAPAGAPGQPQSAPSKPDAAKAEAKP